jgi:hypothetical protein
MHGHDFSMVAWFFYIRLALFCFPLSRLRLFSNPLHDGAGGVYVQKKFL